MKGALRRLLFRLSPERAHHLTLTLLRLAGPLSPARKLLQTIFQAPDKPVEVFGRTFRNPLGLAAGYDKDGLAWRGLAALGFGHIEIGTVTPRPQAGNARPRVFRLVEDRALINRLGFPGRGAQFVAKRLRGPRPAGLILGVNLGKNKDTLNERAAEDYLELLEIFFPLADYLAINVSSPNTEGLRSLQARRPLEELLAALVARRNELTQSNDRQSSAQPALLVKISPDLADDELDQALEAILDSGIDGVIATNTTTLREGLRSAQANEIGGLSGAPLAALSFSMLEKIVRRTAGRLPVINAGGILTPDDARRRLDGGAALVQVYTGLVYAGPGLVPEILESIST